MLFINLGDNLFCIPMAFPTCIIFANSLGLPAQQRIHKLNVDVFKSISCVDRFSLELSIGGN
jgi:hypothetical protein